MSSSPRVIALAVAGLLVLAGCGSTVQQQTAGASLAPGSDGLSLDPSQGLSPTAGQPAGSDSGAPIAGGPTSAPGALAPGASAPRPSVGGVAPTSVKVTTPLSLGILAIGSANGAASAIGANYSTTTTGADVAAALVRFYNKHGGIAGRKIKPVQYTMQATAGNYETEAQAACEKFTHDNKVAAAISVLANGYYANYEQCLTKAGVPDFVGLTGTADDRDLATFPGFISASAPSTNRRFAEMLKRFRASGYLTPQNKVGVIVEDCPYNRRAYDDTIAPLAKQLGLSLTRRDVGCIRGFNDASAAITAFGAAVLPFRSAGVDRVLYVSNFEGVGLLAFETAARSQGYSPSHALTSTTGGAALAGQFDDGQLRRMRGVGWSPVLDLAKRVQASSETKRCRAMLASEGITPQSKADDLIDIVCDQFFLLEASLKATGGRSTRVDLLGALRSLGTGYLSPYSLKGAVDLRVRRDGPRLFAIWGYSTACSCMDYLTSPS